MFFKKFPELADFTTCHGLENGLVIRRVLHQLVNFLHNAFTIPLSQPLQKICRAIIARIPAIPLSTPVWGRQTGTKTDPI